MHKKFQFILSRRDRNFALFTSRFQNKSLKGFFIFEKSKKQTTMHQKKRRMLIGLITVTDGVKS
jgi:hypothetical protein